MPRTPPPHHKVLKNAMPPAPLLHNEPFIKKKPQNRIDVKRKYEEEIEGQAESFKLTFKHTFLNFMVMQIRKPENEDTLFSE